MKILREDNQCNVKMENSLTYINYLNQAVKLLTPDQLDQSLEYKLKKKKRKGKSDRTELKWSPSFQNVLIFVCFF